MLRGTYLLQPDRYPELFALLRRIADANSVAMPHVVAVDGDWNAATAVVGLRRKRVLVIGLPLWVSLRPPERVALLAHEFGHFAHEDSLRTLLAQPALTTFGRLARAVRPPGPSESVEGTGAGLLLLAWQIVGGLTFALLWTIHIGLNVAGFRERRRAELRADMLAANTAGTRAAASGLEVSAAGEMLAPFISADA